MESYVLVGLVDLRHCLSVFICPNSVCFLIRCVVPPGHNKRKLSCIAFMKVDLEGEKQDACRYVAKSCALLSTLNIIFMECFVGEGHEMM